MKLLKKYLDIKNEEVKLNAMILCYPSYIMESAHKGSFDSLLGEKKLK